MLVTDMALVTSLPQRKGSSLHDKQHPMLLAFCQQPLTHERSSSFKPTGPQPSAQAPISGMDFAEALPSLVRAPGYLQEFFCSPFILVTG